MLKKLITGAAIFACLLPAFLHGQQQPRPASLAELDQFLIETAIRLDLRLRGLPREGGEMPRIGVGDFTMADEQVALGDIWRNGVLDTLANVQNRTYALRETAAPPNDYLLSGVIMDAGSSVRITTRIIRAADSSVIASWNSDLAKTPFTMGLLETPGDSRVRRDRFESDSRENPVAVEAGGAPVSRTIHSGEDRDFFLVRHEGAGMLRAETEGGMDTMMELYDEGGRTIASDDDGGSGGNARIVFPAEDGKNYIVMVRGYGSETGSYTFRVSGEEIPDLAREPNNNREQASPIGPGELSAAFVPAGDIDWYSLEIPGEGARLVVFTEGGSDTRLALYNSGGDVLAEDDDSGSGENARISMNLPGGTVYIKASLYGGDSSSVSYTLQTRIQPPLVQDEWEPDNSALQAKDIEAGIPQTRNFDSGKDEDWAKFAVTQAGPYTFRARGVQDTDLDTVITLFDSLLNPIDEDDDGGDGYDSLLSLDLAPGIYYIRVTTLDNDPVGNYTLSVSAE
ncbi:MAG: DVUA0089 family protein [Treponema sp.]|jgi:hypothetical protein|nr:DVUA0089 family protein [Treponema sp.]